MATKNTVLKKGEWTLISETACYFENMRETKVFAAAAETKPDIDTEAKRTVMPGECNIFNPQDSSKLWAIAIGGDSSISYDDYDG